MAGMPALADGSVMPRVVIPFTGTLDFKAPKIVLTFGIERADGAGSVTLEVVKPAAGRFDLKADIRHVATPLGDAAAILSGRFELVGADPLHRELLAEVSTRYTLLNYKPVRDVYFKFAVRDQHLTVDPFLFGALSGHGQISLMGQHEMDVSIDLLSADLEDLWSVLRGQGMKTPPWSGIITGSLTLQGPWGKPVVAGHGAAYNGRWKNFGYETIDLRFEGMYPLIRLKDGKAVSSDGPSFKIDGAVDFSDLARLGAQIRQLKHEFIVADDESGRTRSFRLNASDGHATRLKSFLSGNADGRNQGEQIIGLEKQIGF
jgi:hypothetical protein